MKLYDLYDGDGYIGAFTARQISEMTGCETAHVSAAVQFGYKVKRRYKIEPTEDYTLAKKDWLLLEDFDYVTSMLRKCHLKELKA